MIIPKRKIKPLLKGMTNGSKCDSIILVKRFTDGKNKITGIDAPRANQKAFTAKHTLLYFFIKPGYFTSFNECNDLPGIEIGKVAAATGGSTSATGNTEVEGSLKSPDILPDSFICLVVIYLPVFVDCITKFDVLRIVLHNYRFSIS
jgi:hypothetical protein